MAQATIRSGAELFNYGQYCQKSLDTPPNLKPVPIYPLLPIEKPVAPDLSPPPTSAF